jgi:mannan endo-1,4-beta-mannosidase
VSAAILNAAPSRRPFACLAAAVVLLALLGCGGASGSRNVQGNAGTVTPPAPLEGAPKLSGVVTPPASGAYIGLYRPPAPFEMSAFDSYTATTSPKQPAILMWYQPWAESGPSEFDQAMVVSVLRRQAVPMITWEPWNPGTDANFVEAPATAPRWQLRNILDGKFDDYIRRWARAAKGVGGPVMIRPMHEMNGRWYPWAGTSNGNTPSEFVETWRYIHDVFDAEGATNVTWVWSINWESVPNTAENGFAAYYPGDKYVDWVGISGFNWGTTDPPSRWLTFDEIYDKPLAYLRTLQKPIVLAEFGSVEQGGDKAAWITDAYQSIRSHHPEVRGVVYFDALEVRPKNTQDWRIDSSPGSADAYRRAVASPFYVEAPSRTLARWVDGLSAENQVYLRSLPAIY